MADRFEDLRTFTAVVSCGGIDAAAAELGIAKSAVSRRISDMEKRLGTVLIERSTRCFEPTAVGAEYARRAAALLSSLDELDGSATAAGSGAIVTISASTDLIAHVLIPALGMGAGDVDGTVLRFSDLRADAAVDIVVEEEVRSGLECRRLLSTVFDVCASPGYLAAYGTPDDPKDLAGHAIIATGDNPTPEWRFRQARWRLHAASIVAPDQDAAATAAIAGLGLAQFDGHVVRAAVADGRLSRVLQAHAPPASPIHACYRSDADLGTRRVIDTLADALRR